MRKANETKDLPPLIIDEPQDNGRLYPVAPPEKVDIQLVSRPFITDPSKPFPAVICPPNTEVNTPESDNHASQRRTSQTAVSQERESLSE